MRVFATVLASTPFFEAPKLFTPAFPMRLFIERVEDVSPPFSIPLVSLLEMLIPQGKEYTHC